MATRKLLIAHADIRRQVQELGRRITADYAGRPLVVLGILNGAFIFMADLVREIKLPIEIDFIRVSSYGASSCSSGEIKFSKEIELSISGKEVLLVEDIIDTGRTISCLQDYLSRFQPKSVSICALINKKERRELEIAPKYIGFEVEKGFLVGYGLDYAEQHRHYPEIYNLEL